MANEVDSSASLIKQHVSETEAPEYDPTVKEAVVGTDSSTGKVDRVVLDEHVSHESDLAVQIPPEADGTRLNTLGVLGEPSPEQAFATAPDVDPDVELED